MRKLLFVLFWLLMMGAGVFAAPAEGVFGRVLDSSGAAIKDARVQSRCGPEQYSTTSDSSGNSTISAARHECTLVVSAPGFRSQTVPAEDGLTVTLVPQAAEQKVTVTASRSSVANSDLPITAFAKTGTQLQTQPPLTIDDKLRQRFHMRCPAAIVLGKTFFQAFR